MQQHKVRSVRGESNATLPAAQLWKPPFAQTAYGIVLHKLAHDEPTMQRDLLQMLQVERATLSGIVTTLVRKGVGRTDARSHRSTAETVAADYGGICFLGPST